MSFGNAPQLRRMLDGWAETARPREVLSPSAWAERYRIVDFGPFKGRWRNSNGPHLVGLMDAVQEAMETGRDLVVIKGAQEGVTEAIGVNCVAWLLANYGGPVLYLTSKDDIAKRLVRDRWEHALKTCEPIRDKHLAGKGNGETILAKRFTDGSLQLSGSVSILNFLSNPYAVVVFDELDSCQDEMQDGSDPIALVRERLTAMAEGRPVLLIAFAHPTTRERGAAKIYYSLSDQRRGHVSCPHCGQWTAPLWEHVQVIPEEGELLEVAERNPDRYHLAGPCCGAIWTDAERRRAIRRVEQRPTLPAEEAKRKQWIGCHVWHLFLRKAGAIRELARKHIAGLEDPGVARVFVNKACGDAYEQTAQDTTIEEWRSCVVVPRSPNDRDAYARGQVPPGVQYLTAGQDSRGTELHWAVWGWGLVEDSSGFNRTCGWLIDCGIVRRKKTPTIEAADLKIFGDLLYDRAFQRTESEDALWVRHGYHDSGWCPVAVYEYCSTRPGRAVPARGDNLNERQAVRTPAHRWGAQPRWRVGQEEVTDPRVRLAILNTYLLKEQLFGLVGTRFERANGAGPQSVVTLPVDVPERFLAESCSESLKLNKGVREWVARGPNHYSDCNVQAFGAGLQLRAFLKGETRDEQVQRAQAKAEAGQRKRLERQRGGGRRTGPHRRPIRRSY